MGFWNKFEEGKLWVIVRDNKNNELVSFLREAEKAGFELPGSPYVLSNYLNDFYFNIGKEIVVTYKNSFVFTNEEKFDEALEKSEKKDLFLWDWDNGDALLMPGFEACSNEFDKAFDIVLYENLCEEEAEEDSTTESVDEIHICSCKDRADDCSSPCDHCRGCDNHIEGKTISNVVESCSEDKVESCYETETKDENEMEKMRESLRTIYNHLRDYGYEDIFINFFDSLADEIEKDFNNGEDYYE